MRKNIFLFRNFFCYIKPNKLQMLLNIYGITGIEYFSVWAIYSIYSTFKI